MKNIYQSEIRLNFWAAMLKGELNTFLHGGRKKILTIKYGIINNLNQHILLGTHGSCDVLVQVAN